MEFHVVDGGVKGLGYDSGYSELLVLLSRALVT